VPGSFFYKIRELGTSNACLAKEGYSELGHAEQLNFILLEDTYSGVWSDGTDLEFEERDCEETKEPFIGHVGNSIPPSF
jgi:hypothetical protein